MKIRVEPGVVVRLDRRRSTSQKGGEYDIAKLSEQDRKRVLETKGVSQLSGGQKGGGKSTTKAEGE